MAECGKDSKVKDKDLRDMKKIRKAVCFVLMFMEKLKKDRVDAYSAQSAFYIIMGFIPFVMLVLTLLQYTPLTPEDMMNVLTEALPDHLQGLVTDAVNSVFDTSTALLSGTAIAAVWACGRAVLAITKGLNSIHDIEETRNYVIMRVRSSFYILVLLVAFVLTLGLLVFGNQIHGVIVERVPFFQRVSNFIISVRTIAMLVVLTLLFAAMYTMLPNSRQHFLWQIPGAAVASVSWSVFSYGFSIYLNYAQGMSAVYGSLTTVVMLMLWLYFCVWLLFLGAEINVYLEKPESFDNSSGKSVHLPHRT